MNWIPALTLLLGVTLGLPAAAPPPKRASEPSSAASRVMHYLTADGTIGFVLDRSGDLAKLRFDGKTEVYELTLQEDREAGRRRGIRYLRPDGTPVIYIELHGGMKLLMGPDAFPLQHGTATKPLPAASMKGQHMAPKSLHELAVEQLTPRSLMAKHREFTVEDSANLAKVARAFERVDPSMIVHINATGSENARWAPASSRIGDTEYSLGDVAAYAPVEAPAKPEGLAKYGGVLRSDRLEFDRPSRLRLHPVKGWPAPLAVGTPGILWSVLDGTLVFVTFDGGRYRISLTGTDENTGLPVTVGLRPKASWPAPLQHSLVEVETLRYLAKGGAIPAKIDEEIAALDDGWFKAIRGVWKETWTRIEALKGTGDEKTREERIWAMKEEAVRQAAARCEPERLRLEQGLVSFIETRNAERLALHQKVTAQFESKAK